MQREEGDRRCQRWVYGQVYRVRRDREGEASAAEAGVADRSEAVTETIKVDTDECLKNAGAPEELRKRFAKYHAAHPRVWELFKIYSDKAYVSGKRKFSAWAIINRVRWDHEIESTSGRIWEGDFKVPNEFIALYSRMMMAVFPKFKEFFHTRPLKGDEETQDWAG